MAASFATTGLVLLLSLGTSVLLARSLGPDGRGLLLALTFWPGLLFALFSMSLNESTAYHVAQRHGSGGDADAFAGSALWLTILVALVAVAATILVLPIAVPIAYHDHLGLVTLYAAAFVPLSALDLYFRAVLQGRGAILAINLVRTVQSGAYLVLLVLCLSLRSLDVATIMAVILAALALSMLTGAVLARVPWSTFRTASIRPSVSTGWKFHQANVLLYGAAEIDKLMVLLLMPIAAVGLYAVAVATSAIGAGVVVQSLGLMLVRDMAASTDAAWRRSVFVSNIRAAFAVLIGLNGIAAALAGWWVPFLFGSAFGAAVPVTMILLAMGVFKGARQMIDRSLRAMHHTRTGMIGEIAALAGIAVLGPIGAVTAGLGGIAAGIAVAQALSLALALLLSKRQIGFSWIELWPLQRAALSGLGEFLAAQKLPRGAP